MENKQALKQFRVIAFLEGISYLILVFVAMPFKYFGGILTAVKYPGMVHGVLFVAFVVWLVVCHLNYKWTIKFSAIAFLLSLVPFGTFILDKKLKVQE